MQTDILSEIKKHLGEESGQNLAALGLGTVFVIFGVWELINPIYWQAYVPGFLKDLHPLLLVQLHGGLMTLTGLGVNIDVFRKESSIIASLLMLEIVVSLILESGFSDILVRDIGLLFMAFALTAQTFREQFG